MIWFWFVIPRLYKKSKQKPPKSQQHINRECVLIHQNLNIGYLTTKPSLTNHILPQQMYTAKNALNHFHSLSKTEVSILEMFVKSTSCWADLHWNMRVLSCLKLILWSKPYCSLLRWLPHFTIFPKCLDGILTSYSVGN